VALCQGPHVKVVAEASRWQRVVDLIGSGYKPHTSCTRGRRLTPSQLSLNQHSTVPLNNAQMGLGALGEMQMRSRGANGRLHTIVSCSLYHPPNGHLVWRLSIMTLWTGFKQQYFASEASIGPNEEERSTFASTST